MPRAGEHRALELDHLAAHPRLDLSGPGTKLKRQPMLAKVCYSVESRPVADVLNTSAHDRCR